MTRTHWALAGATLGLGALMVWPSSAKSQGIAGRIAAAPAGNVQFAFAARDGVCGDGTSWLSSGNGSFSGTINISSSNDASFRASCLAGAIRITLIRVDREIVDLDVNAGPLTPDADVTNLGVVSARDASAYLLSLATQLDGKPSRLAIMPAALADSASPASGLLAIARDARRPLDTRRSAISWVARDGSSDTDASVRALMAMARDADQPHTIRTSAISAIARMDVADGVPQLMRLANEQTDPWAAMQATDALGRSADPRAREALREIVSRSDAPEDVRASAISGLMRSYATSADAELLRRQFNSQSSEKSRDAIISALASMGGRENADWLLSVAKNTSVSSRHRRRAIALAARAGVTVQDFVGLYDAVEDRDLRDATLSVLAEGGTRTGTDKLLDVARGDTDVRLRRKAVSLLSRSADPRVQTALKNIVMK